MDVAAILIVSDGKLGTAEDDAGTRRGTFADVPLPLLDVLGRSPAAHTVGRLRRCGGQSAAIVFERRFRRVPALQGSWPENTTLVEAETGTLSRAAEDTFVEYSRRGADYVFIIKMGCYAEIDYSDLLRYHLTHHQHVTFVEKTGEPLNIAVANADRRNDFAFLLRHDFSMTRMPSSPYRFAGYMNPLVGPADLRNLGRDGLLLRCELRPLGAEVKPGIWIGKHATIRSSARILAPAFIGEHAKVHANALITRCSSVERCAEIDFGTVVEDSSVLPHTRVGAGLDVNHGVVGFHHFAHLRRNVVVEISDSALVSVAREAASRRAMAASVSAMKQLSTQLSRRFRKPVEARPGVPERDVSSGDGKVAAGTELPFEIEEFAQNFAVARRYGEQ